MIIKKPFLLDDFLRVRDFLVETYGTNAAHPNWLIDRWNFVRSFSQTMHETTHSWPGTVGLWQDEHGKILAVAHSEGENRGEAFLQLRPEYCSRDLLEEMLEHVEAHLIYSDGSDRKVLLRVGEGFSELQNILRTAGYVLQDWNEPTASLEINGSLPVHLPRGFTIADGNQVSDAAKGFAHGRAFGYYTKDEPDDDDAERCFQAVRQAPDYLAELDLCVLTPSGEIGAFAAVWYDAANRIGILEPVGTIPQCRRLGLGKAVIHESINRAKKLGARKMYVGSDQPFYLALGFEVEYTHQVWEKVLADRS